MKIQHCWILTLVIALGFGIPALSESASAASPPSIPAGQHKVYWVYYRVSPNSGWILYGAYHAPNTAQQAVHYFQSRGYDAFYR